jgi:primase-polymerase (primpol)-like protein
VWRYEDRRGKPAKVPYEPWAGKLVRARINDPASWNTFGVAITAFEFGRGNFDGLMFALTPDDPFAFVDLDHCRDPRTGHVDPWAREIIDFLAGYTEISPSGTGVHIFVRGSLPPFGRKKGNFEVYDRGRFATVTGNRLEYVK